MNSFHDGITRAAAAHRTADICATCGAETNLPDEADLPQVASSS